MDILCHLSKVICPPFVSLVSVGNLLQGSSVGLGAQNMYFEDKGAFTGEVSPLMLSGLCQYVILGHSERRQYFKEDDDLINKKMAAALRHNLIPILCVGETLEEKEAGKTEEKVTRQVKDDLRKIGPSSLIVAYEPIWAIGTGKTASGQDANRSITAIRKTIGQIWDSKIAEDIIILYGGSTNASNIREFIHQEEIDGALVGGSSLKPGEFVEMARLMAKP
jgi:triosephosphate isomerase